MTAPRQDGAPARRRAGQRRTGGLRAAAGMPVAGQAPEVPSEVPTVAATAGTPSAGRGSTTKYTALLDDTTAVAFDELALMARRRLGRRVDKSQLMRALILLAADDASLRDQVIDQIGRA